MSEKFGQSVDNIHDAFVSLVTDVVEGEMVGGAGPIEVAQAAMRAVAAGLNVQLAGFRERFSGKSIAYDHQDDAGVIDENLMMFIVQVTTETFETIINVLDPATVDPDVPDLSFTILPVEGRL